MVLRLSSMTCKCRRIELTVVVRCRSDVRESIRIRATVRPFPLGVVTYNENGLLVVNFTIVMRLRNCSRLSD
jgi:hypothetical protein